MPVSASYSLDNIPMRHHPTTQLLITLGAKMAWLLPGSRIRRQRAERQDRYAAELANLQLEIMKAVMAKAREALEHNEFDVYKSLSSQVFEAGYLDPGLSSETPEQLTRHERSLDGWRIVTTIVLVGGLLIVVGLVLFTKASTNTATPFISLVSGLAGIALGWMFAGAGNSNVAKRVAAGPKRGAAQKTTETQPAAAPAGPAPAPAGPAPAGPAAAGQSAGGT